MREELTLRQRLAFAAAIGSVVGLQVPLWLGLFGSIFGLLLGFILAIAGAFVFFYIEKTVGLIDRALRFLLSVKTGLFWAHIFYLAIPATIFAFDCLFLLSIFLLCLFVRWDLFSADPQTYFISFLFSVIYVTLSSIREPNRLVQEYRNTVFMTVWRKFLSDLKIIFQFRPLRNDIVWLCRTMSDLILWVAKVIVTTILIILFIITAAVVGFADSLYKKPVLAALVGSATGFLAGWAIHGKISFVAPVLALIIAISSALGLGGLIGLILAAQKAYQLLTLIGRTINSLWSDPYKIFIEE